uniref:Uncharacterized protein n=1 Tax=Fundulus heteroclitus TaxID=8078 RepID=A0A3Q2PYX9_FUNHE
MELKFEVVLSSSIKRKKPWPRFCWLGQEKESVFLLDDKRISEINMVSGRTKKRTPKLHPLLSNVVKMASSHNGMWLCGLLASGELFLWNRDKDLLKTAAAEPEYRFITLMSAIRWPLCLQVSCNGTRVLLAAITGQVFLWESTEGRDFPGLRDGPVKGQWAHLLPLEETLLPSSKDKEASQHTIFVKTEVLADICLSAFVFTSGKQLVVTILKIQWSRVFVSSWATKTYPMSHLCPPCQPVKSRGALVPAFSPDGRLLAVALNQRKPKDTQVLFVSTHNFVSISSHLGGCGSKKMDIPSKYVRSYWVSSVSWSAEGLFFACVLKRGSLLMLARLGGLLTLTSSGCNVDFGPAHFLPLHPLVTYRFTFQQDDTSLSSSSLSVRDLLRQRFSVTWHPRLLYLIVSDGYMATVMKVRDRHSPALFLEALLKETGRDLEKASVKLEKSQVIGGGDLNQQSLGGTRELLEKPIIFYSAAFEEESDLEGLPAGPHVQEGGRLEFASMFDTLHAADTYGESALFPELGKIQRKLLAAWALAMSVGDAAEHRVRLLRHALRCVVWFAALLRSAPRREKDAPVCARLLRLIKALLSFLSWDSASSAGRRCLGPMVEFSEWMARLLLSPPPDAHLTGRCPVSSQSLSDVTRILHLVSASLDRTYCLEQKSCWSNEEEFSSSRPHLWLSDVPLNAPFTLLGEHLFLCGLYSLSTQTLRLQICQEASKGKGHSFALLLLNISSTMRLNELPRVSLLGGDRSVFQQTRLCLALLYSLLSRYHLREAQEFGDGVAQLILLRAGSRTDSLTGASDPLEGEDWELLRASVHDILKASAMAGVDVMSFPLSALLEKAKDACSLLPTLVPAEVYLPSPPLYCPQPSPNTQDPMGETEQFAEVICRHKVSGVLQRLLLLLRSAHCCRPAAQWYVGRLRRARHILHKCRNLIPLANICFRELCALCWMLHVRDQLSLHCRKYQAEYPCETIPDDSHVNSTNADALRWACRLLPFAHFLGGEEVLQDLMLSLLPELPPAADTLVRAFPQEEESVRVSLREKYNLLLQRLGQCSLLGTNASFKARKHLARLQRHLAPPELHLWQKADEDEGRGGANDTLSLGTTVSSGTLTDGAFQPVCSDADTPEAVSPKQARALCYFNLLLLVSKKAHKGDQKAASGMENARTSGEREKEWRSLPAVGSWEFELEDEEYLSFLELFLSYVLEKDAVDSMDCGEELPLLKGFCSQLREKELHSLTFDVVSTIHRRQRGGLPLERKQSAKPRSVFRTGCSYRAVASSLWSEDPVVGPDTSSHPGRGAETQKGLLGRRRPSDVSSAGGKEADVGSESSFFQNAFTARRPSESPLPGFSSSVEAPTDLQEGLDPELEARFPELGRLLEWMVRWADRRMLLGHRGKKREDVAGRPDEGVVIRVKATAPAILTSLGMLENRYAAQPQTDHSTSPKRIPERQWTVAPALPSDAERRTERESSVDTGYPASVNTPIWEEKLPINGKENLRQNRAQYEWSSALTDWGLQKTEQIYRLILADKDFVKCRKLYSLFLVLFFSSPHSYPVNPAPPTIQPKPPPHAESSDSRSVPLPDPAADRPRLQPPISSSGAAPADSTAATLPLLTSPTRQRLGDDLFRLVQHINYMSLSEVLGATFSSLQLAQQSSSFAGPTTDSSQPNMHLPSAPGIIPEPNAFPVQTTATAVPQTQARVPKSESGDPEASRIESRHVAAQPVTQGAGVSLHHCSQSQLASAGSVGATLQVFLRRSVLTVVLSLVPRCPHTLAVFVFQETQPLSVQTESPDVHQRQKRSLIPSSYGLPAATDDGRAVQRPPSDGGAQTGSAAQMLDLKLLKLHLPCAESQHAAAPRYAAQRARTLHTANFEPPESSQPEVPHHDRATWRKKDERQRNGFPVQIRNLIYNPAYDPLTVAQAVPLLPPVHGLRLLRLQDDARSTVTFPKLAMASTPRPAAISEAPIIRLLRIESGPKMVSSSDVSPRL